MELKSYKLICTDRSDLKIRITLDVPHDLLNHTPDVAVVGEMFLKCLQQINEDTTNATLS